jgi:hypothetical protein
VRDDAKTRLFVRPESPGQGRLRRAALLALVLGPVLVQVFSFVRVGRTIRLTDEYFYHVQARSWYFDRDCDYENDMRMAPGFANASLYIADRTVTGYVRNHFQTGTAIVSYPLIAVADGLTALHNAAGLGPLPRDGFSAYYQFVTSMGHTLLGVLGLLGAYAVAARYFAGWAAALGALATWAGTSAVFYVGYESTHSHAASVGWVGLMMLATDTIRWNGLSWRWLAALGLFAGMTVVTRPQDVLWVSVPLVVLAPALWPRWRQPGQKGRVGLGVLLAVVVAVVCYAPQAVVNVRHAGAPVVNTYASVRVQGRLAVLDWTAPDLLRPLAHPRTGLGRTAPLALLGVAGVLSLPWRRERMLTAVTVGFVLSYYAVSCVWWDFTSYGNRYLMSATPAFAIGLAGVLAWSARARWRVVAAGLTALACVGWQAVRFVGVVYGL